MSAHNTHPQHPQQPPIDSYALENTKFMTDFFSFHAPTDGILAPHPDLFESEVDLNLAGLDDTQLPIQLLVDHSAESFSFLRHNDQSYGPPSTLTVSSESEYNSYRSELDSYYSYPTTDDANSSVYSPNPNPITVNDHRYPFNQLAHNNGHAYTTGLEPEFANMDIIRSRFSLPDPNDYRNVLAQQPTATGIATAEELQQLGHLMQTSADPAVISASPDSPEYFSTTPTSGTGSISPLNTMSGMGPSHPSLMTVQVRQPEQESRRDPRKKYQCPNCPRAFARAYNLKTHMATHDPNRLKPHVCPHRSCGRSFSRRHDLGRHLVSIHRDDPPAMPQMKKSSAGGAIGVTRSGRSWCDDCGRSMENSIAHECRVEEVR